MTMSPIPTPMRRRELRRTLRKAYAKDPPFEEFEDKALSSKSRALAREKMLYQQLLETLKP